LPLTTITVRYPSGRVEHRYGDALPAVGDKLGANGDEAFVTSVELGGDGRATVMLGSPVPTGVRWSDAMPASSGTARSAARERILETAYELFSRRSTRDVGVNELIEHARVTKATFYRHFPTKNDLVLAFLHRREHRWTREFVEAEARRRGATPRERLLAIFDVFDEWFQQDGFEGCSFINVLLERQSLQDPVGRASAAHLEFIRSVVGRLADEAGVRDVETFARSWHILMKGSIVTAQEGDRLAARRAKALASLLLDEHLKPDESGAAIDEATLSNAASNPSETPARV
jgi:AcrR family transcriptional regulator